MRPPDPPQRARERFQVLALAGTFLARFFENEITAGSKDLKHSFIWLIAAMATPGLVMPNIGMSRWSQIAVSPGPEGGLEFLRRVSAIDIVFTLGVTMVTIGLLAAIVWHSLLVDRRDVLVLGGFPVRHRTVLTAKIAALAAFFAIVSVGMHTLAAVFYGVYLGGLTGFTFGARLVLVHFVTATAAGLFMLLLVIAAQGLLLSLSGPRLFARLAPIVQLVLVASVLLLFVALPITAAASIGTIHHLGSRSPEWVLWMPPVWFLGLYETLQGTSIPILHALGGRAAMALGGVAAIALLTYPLAYRRIASASLVGFAASRVRPSIAARVVAWIPRLLSREPVTQATVQFALTTLGRSGLHRLVLAMAGGVALALVVPIVGANVGRLSLWPTRGLLALTTILMTFFIGGLRIAFALPAELSAAWIFAVSSGQHWTGHRSALRRVVWLLGVALPILVTTPIYWTLWGSFVAVGHAVVSLALGALLTELALIGIDGMPCAKPYEPGRAHLESRWGYYLLLLMILMIQIPSGEADAFRYRWPVVLAVLSILLSIGALGTRAWAERRLPAPGAADEPDGERVGLALHRS